MVKHAIAVLLLLMSLSVSSARGEAVLLDFYSMNCPPCRQMLPVVDNLKVAGYRIEKVDVTQQPQLAQQYGVTQIPCFVMLVDGREADRVVGATTSQRLQQMYPPVGSERFQSNDVQPGAPMTTAAPAVGRANDPWSGIGGAPSAAQPRGGEDAEARFALTSTPAACAVPSAQDAALVSSSVRIKVEDSKGHAFGTGTIIDARKGQALVITCGHLFRDSQGKGTVTIEIFEVTPQGLRVVDRVPGQVINYNEEREIGLIGIWPKVPVRPAKIAATQTVMARGDRVTSVGCDNGQDPTALGTRVTATNRYQGPPNIEAHGAPVEGRSGGGLFNTNGELVGVCFAADYEGNEGLYTALESIHDELDRLGLSDIYQPGGAATSGAVAQGPTSQPSVVRGQEPSSPVVPMPNDFGGAQPNTVVMTPAPQGTVAAPAGLKAEEQAAWDEIMARRSDSEVICIIRSKDSAKSEVITLNHLSPEFVDGLIQQAGRAPTTLR